MVVVDVERIRSLLLTGGAFTTLSGQESFVLFERYTIRQSETPVLSGSSTRYALAVYAHPTTCGRKRLLISSFPTGASAYLLRQLDPTV